MPEEAGQGREQPPAKRARSGAPGADDGTPLLLEDILPMAAHIWTASEGEASAALKARVPRIRASLRHLDSSEALRVHAALGPLWWMVGLAKEGCEAVSGYLESHQRPVAGVADGAVPGDPPGESRIDLPRVLDLAGLPDVGSGGPFLQGASSELLLGCALDGAGMNSYATAAYADAWRYHASAYAAVASQGGVDAEVVRSRAMDGLGRVARETGRYELAWRLHAGSCNIAMAVVGQLAAVRPVPLTCVANAVSNAGVVRYRQKDFEHAEQLHRAALDLRKRSGDRRGLASSQGNLALLLPPAEALSLYQESLETREVLGDPWGVAGSLRALADTHQKLGQGAQARGCTARAAKIFAQVRDNLGIAECLESLGLIDDRGSGGHGGGSEAAAALLGAAVAVRRAIDASVEVVMHHGRAAALKGACPGAWSEGEGMTLESATALLLRACSRAPDL